MKIIHKKYCPHKIPAHITHRMRNNSYENHYYYVGRSVGPPKQRADICAKLGFLIICELWCTRSVDFARTEIQIHANVNPAVLLQILFVDMATDLGPRHFDPEKKPKKFIRNVISILNRSKYEKHQTMTVQDKS